MTTDTFSPTTIKWIDSLDPVVETRGITEDGDDMNPLLQTFEVVDDRLAEALRQKTDAQSLRSVDAFWCSARAILQAAIRTEHPDWSLDRVQREIARRISNGARNHVDT